jgi:DNA primase
MSSTVDQVKQRLSIVDVVSPYVKLVRAGVNHKARCPFHNEKTPSFTVSPERGTYHCFGCGVGGDIFTFVQEMEGVDFKGALKILADKAGVPIVFERGEKRDTTDRIFMALEEATKFFEKNLTERHPAREYLIERGINAETIASFRLGWVSNDWRTLTTHLREKKFTDKEIEAAGLAKKTEKGLYDRFRSRIMFPLFDPAGRVVGFSGRIFEEKGNVSVDAPKYINSPETALYNKSRLLYGYDRAKQHIRKLNFSILVEGQMDLIATHQAGWKNAVAVSGTALTPDHIVYLMRFSENLVLALDADDAGIEAARRSATAALAAGMDVKVAVLPSGSDPADVIIKEGKEAWRTRGREAKHIVEFLLAILKKKHKDKRAYIKSVRHIVLPFVAMVKSPMDRDHLVRIVAGQIGVGEGAIHAELLENKKNTEPRKLEESSKIKKLSPQNGSALTPRLKQIFGIVLWQTVAEKPLIKKTKLLELLEEHAGEKAQQTLADIPKKEKDSLCFEAEKSFTQVDKDRLNEEIMFLFRLVQGDRLQAELKTANINLAEVEKLGTEAEKNKAFELCTRLTNEIAKLQKKR